MAVLDHFEAVQKIYIAFYQRPADPAGLTYWAKQVEAANGNTQAVMDLFANSDEATELYGPINADTIGDVIDKIYQALFGREPDAEGKQYYVEEFTKGTFTAGNIALTVLNSAQGTDVDAINNKLAVADEYTSQVDGREFSDSEFGNAPFAFEYAGEDAAVAARELLATVTADETTVLDGEAIKKALEGETEPAAFTLAEALAAQEAGELPESYTLSDVALVVEAGTIVDVAAAIAAAQEVVNGAANVEELEFAPEYTIEDTAAAILAAAAEESPLVADVSLITITDEEITSAQRDALVELGFEALPPLDAASALTEGLAALEAAQVAQAEAEVAYSKAVVAAGLESSADDDKDGIANDFDPEANDYVLQADSAVLWERYNLHVARTDDTIGTDAELQAAVTKA
nr:DUF4214 domain-containing protein [Pseudomonas sp.]